jgi:hypothetical protein
MRLQSGDGIDKTKAPRSDLAAGPSQNDSVTWSIRTNNQPAAASFRREADIRQICERICFVASIADEGQGLFLKTRIYFIIPLSADEASRLKRFKHVRQSLVVWQDVVYR